MSRFASWVAGVLTAVLVACSGIVLSAETHAPNVFESAYYYLALDLNAPQLCDKISPDAVEHGPLFGHPSMQVRYLQSKCFYHLAAALRDASLCGRVKTISTSDRDGSGISEAKCREHVARRQSSTGGVYGFGLLVGVMGYSDDDIREAYPHHPEPDSSADFLVHLRAVDERDRTHELTARLQRLPDFSRGDAEARRQLYMAVPHCADREANSYECRRVSCALVRAQPGARGCERALTRERPPGPWE